MTLARLMARLLAKAVRQPNGCLTVQCKNRYLEVAFDGRRSRAHRAAWEFYNGRAVPAGFEVCHKCDVTRCIEESHLILGTHAFNMADRDAKGRNGTLGEASPLAKLTAEKVLSIYALVRQGGGLVEVAAQFQISPVTVQRIAERKTWKHILTTLPA